MAGATVALSGWPNDPEIMQALIAFGIAVVAYAVAAAIGRFAGPLLCRTFGLAGPSPTPFAARLGRMLRHAVAALLLAVVLNVWPWQAVPLIVLATPLAAAIALLLFHLLRVLAIAPWLATLVALVLFAMALSGSAGGFAAMMTTLDELGVNLGKRRITILGVISIIATCVLLFAAVRLANRIIGKSIGRADGFDPTQKLLAQKLSAIAVVVVAFFVGIDMLGIDLTAFAVFSGALGLAVGFGLQKTFGNLIAGIILLMDRSIKPGDVIVVGDSFGWVNKIGVRAVSVVTRDGKEHLIPNENLMTQEVENWSYSDRNVRVRIPVGVSYDGDLKLAQQLMLDAALASPRVLRNPKPNVWLTGFGDNRIEHDILVWISDPESGVGNVRSDVLNRLWVMFQEHGIVIPYPQRSVTIRNNPSRNNDALTP